MSSRSFEEIYQKEYRALLGLAYVLTGDRAQAEDLTHDTFAAALDSWDKLSHPEAWLRQVLVNKNRSGLRRRYAEGRALVRLGMQAVSLPDETIGFWEIVRSLPRRQAQAIALFYLDDRPVSEIARVLGCSEPTARVHLTRGRRTLADKLGVEE